jgi:hypothetical protein
MAFEASGDGSVGNCRRGISCRIPRCNVKMGSGCRSRLGVQLRLIGRPRQALKAGQAEARSSH